MPKRTTYYKILTIIGGIIIPAVATFVAITTFITEKRAEKIEIDAQVISSEELTTRAPEVELKSHYSWSGEEVANLWKLKINFVNLGGKTIIGKGNQRNILNDGLNFEFPYETRILRVKTEDQSFKNTIELANNKFKIQFSQWRAQEYITACFYISSEEFLTEAPFPIVQSRDIIDGNVFVQDLRESKPSEKLFLIDKLPKFLSRTGKIIGGILAGIMLFFAYFFNESVWGDFVKFSKWKNWEKRYLSTFKDYLDKRKPSLSAKKKKEYSINPDDFPKKFWADFHGPLAPKKETQPIFNSIGKCILATLASIVIIFGLVSLILIMIPA